MHKSGKSCCEIYWLISNITSIAFQVGTGTKINKQIELLSTEFNESEYRIYMETRFSVTSTAATAVHFYNKHRNQERKLL